MPPEPHLGFVELDHVWLDDRMTCEWALAGLSLVAEPGTTIALLSEGHDHAPDAVLDLLTGRRLPCHGRVEFDGTTAIRPAVTEVRVGDERRAVVAGQTVFVAHPRPATIAGADRVVVLDAGRVIAEGRLQPAAA